MTKNNLLCINYGADEKNFVSGSENYFECGKFARCFLDRYH